MEPRRTSRATGRLRERKIEARRAQGGRGRAEIGDVLAGGRGRLPARGKVRPQHARPQLPPPILGAAILGWVGRRLCACAVPYACAVGWGVGAGLCLSHAAWSGGWVEAWGVVVLRLLRCERDVLVLGLFVCPLFSSSNAEKK